MQAQHNNSPRVSQLWMYPIKSLAGIPLQQATVFAKGFQHDRRWMLVDSNGEFMTQRKHHQMALFKTASGINGFHVGFEDEEIFVPFTYHPKSMQASIWNDVVQVHEVSSDISEFFSDWMGIKCRLVFFPEENMRLVDTDYAKQQEQVSLADGYPILVIGQASLDDLNSRLELPVPMNRFRPNIVVSGSAPYEEDNWQQFKIGDAQLAGVKPCGRCVVTTIDQALATSSTEPLATLSTYRKKVNSVLFGQNVLVRSEATIAVGDELVFL